MLQEKGEDDFSEKIQKLKEKLNGDADSDSDTVAIVDSIVDNKVIITPDPDEDTKVVDKPVVKQESPIDQTQEKAVNKDSKDENVNIDKKSKLESNELSGDISNKADLKTVPQSENDSETDENILKKSISDINVEKVIKRKKRKKLVIPEFNSLINTLFSDEEKGQFKIVPNEEFFYENNELKLIVDEDEYYYTEEDNREDELLPIGTEHLAELVENRDSELTVEDFVKLLYTYYEKDTKISKIKIGDIFLLLSSIKLDG